MDSMKSLGGWRMIRWWWLLGMAVALIALAGCGGGAQPTPTRTPVPTYTPTPEGFRPAAVAAAAQAIPPTETPAPPDLPTPTETPEPATSTPTPEPPTETPTPTPEPPTETPTVTPTFTPTFTPTPTPTPDYPFALEAAEQFPTQLPDVDEVRIYLYVYAEDNYAVENYSLRVLKDGDPLLVQARSTGGLPGETRPGPSPHTRFANLGAAFFEPAIGVWDVQLINPNGELAGPPTQFVLAEDDPLREIYVRYRRK
jgi:hypothetical protein